MTGKLKFDWHTHTKYSHGLGTIEENVEEARKKGLESIAISDHGPGHFGYGFKRKDIPLMRAEIEALNEKYDDIKIYLSAEANVINRSGLLDVKPEEFELYDFVIAGYHFGTLGTNPVGSLLLHLCNLICSAIGRFPGWLVNLNTKICVNSILSNKLVTLTHPGDKGKVNLDEVFKACEKTGTYLEISNRHRQLTVDEIRQAMPYDVSFIIGSDAHVPEKVGTCERALKKIEEAGLDPARVVNLIVD